MARTQTVTPKIKKTAGLFFLVRALVSLAVLVLALILALAYVFAFRRGGTTASSPEISSLAVLPLKNLSGDQAQEYLPTA